MIVYTAMGDSITRGVGATCPANAYPQRIVSMLHSQHKKACLQLEAYPGWTSLDLLNALINLNPMKLRNSTVTSIWIGGDNLVLAGLSMLNGANKRIIPDTLSCYKRDMTMIIKFIQQVSPAKIVLCTQYNPFPRSSLAKTAIASLNGITEQLAKQYHVYLVPIHRWFEGRQSQLIAGYHTGRLEDVQEGAYPIHPNNLGHQVIAQGLIPYIGRSAESKP